MQNIEKFGGTKLLLADPPWSYNKNSENVTIPEHEGKRKSHSSYCAMQDGELVTLYKKIRKIMAPDSIICQWTVGGRMDFSIKLLKVAGFQFSSILLNWVKTDKFGRPFVGMGMTTRQCCEYVLLGRKGKGLPTVDRGIPDVIMVPRPGRHSEKPKIHGLLTRLFGVPTGRGVEALEIFARDVHDIPGWAYWGNEVTITPAQKELFQ